MIIVNSSDWHLDAVTGGVERFPDIADAIDETVQAAERLNADYYLFTGDLQDPDNGGATYGYTAFLLRTALKLRRLGIPSIWLAGNHDVVENGRGHTTLTPLREMAQSLGDEMITVFELPGVLELKGAFFIALPFTASDRSYDPAKAVLETSRGNTALRPSDVPIIVAGHLNIEGIEIGSETTDFPRGRDVFFPQAACADLAKTHEVVKVNGHYHKAQNFEGIHIPGSVARLTFGEEQLTPGYQVIEL